MLRPAALSLVLLATAASAQPAEPCFETDIDALRAAVKRDPGSLGLRLRLAMALLRRDEASAHPDVARERLKEARGQLDVVLEQDPHARVPLRVRALESYRDRRFKDAVRYGRAHLEQVAVDPDVTTLVIRALVRLSRHDEAARVFVEWVEEEGMRSFGEVQGLLFGLAGHPDFRAALKKRLGKAIEGAPGHVMLLLFRAALLARLGRTADAWDVLHEAERLGLCSVRTGGRHPFVRDLRDRSIEPEEGPASVEGSQASELEKRLEQLPKHAGLTLRLARALDLDGRREEALAYYGRSTTLNPRLWTAAYRRGELLMELDRFDEAQAAYRKVLELVPDFPGARLRLAEALLRKGAPDRAVEQLLLVATRLPPDRRTRALLGIMKEEAGAKAVEAAASAFGAAAEKEPANPNLHAHHAVALLEAGREEAARAAALAAERAGLAGRRGEAHPVLLEVFGRPVPDQAEEGR